MRKKIVQVLLFFVVVTVGVFIIDSYLNALPWNCRCFDYYNAERQCDQMCVDHGGCLYYSYYFSDCVCMGGNNECNCQARLECEDGAHGWWNSWAECLDCTSWG